jgi:SAM-dependent methyltransferase
VDPAAYAEHGAYEGSHWWFVGRRAILASLLRPLATSARGRVLAVGCGFGSELGFLASQGRVVGTEIEWEPLRSARAGAHQVAMARAEALPFAAECFDLIAMFDVLEHVAAADRALAEVRRVVRPGGHLVLTVPALQWLWSDWDIRVHHQRRYSARSLAAALAGAGFRLRRMTYFNFLLLPLVAVVRLFAPARRLARPADGNEFALGSSPWANRLLTGVLKAEARFVRRANLPVGVSLAALACREP